MFGYETDFEEGGEAEIMRSVILWLQIAIAICASSSSAQKNLTAAEQEVLRSAIASFMDRAPNAILPPGWSPNIDTICFDNSLRYISCRVLWDIDPVFKERYLLQSNDDQIINLPLRNTAHNLPTTITFANLDSGFIYIGWQQNINEPLATGRIEKALERASMARCIVLDMKNFDALEVDSVLKALSYLTVKDKLSINEIARISGSEFDTTINHVAVAAEQAWCGPLLVVCNNKGWPGCVISSVLQDRPYTTTHFDFRSTSFFGYRYDILNLPHNFRTYVPVSVLSDERGRILESPMSFPEIMCGNDARFYDKRSTYQKYQDTAWGIVMSYRNEETSFGDRMIWNIQNMWNSLFPNETHIEVITE
jgi:hypothetical protein